MNTNLGAASYVLQGNAGTERKGAGSSAAFSVPADTYGITFKPVPGYSLPGPIAPKPLSSGGAIDFTGAYVRSKFVPPANVGVFREGFLWIQDLDGNRAMTPNPDRVFAFGGVGGDIPIVGDWNGSGTTKAGIYRIWTNVFMLDYDGDMQFNASIDKVYDLGIATVPGDRPVVGDWNGDGKTKVGLFHKGFLWILDTNGDGVFQGGVDGAFPYGGGPHDLPIVGDWNGDGRSDPGIFRDGYYWILDYNGDHLMANINQEGGDRGFSYGSPTGDVPLVGDWNGDGLSKPGVLREGFLWILDHNGNYQMDGTSQGQDVVFPYGGGLGDKPVVGRW